MNNICSVIIVFIGLLASPTFASKKINRIDSEFGGMDAVMKVAKPLKDFITAVNDTEKQTQAQSNLQEIYAIFQQIQDINEIAETGAKTPSNSTDEVEEE